MGIFSIMMNALYTLQSHVSCTRCAAADIIITPDFETLSWSDFHRGGEVVQAGRAAARAAIPALRRLLCMTKDKEGRP